MDILFINDSASGANWGDRAAAVSLRQMIETVGGRVPFAITEDELYASRFFDATINPDSPTENRTKEILRVLLPPITLQLRQALLHRMEALHRRDLIPERWEDYKQCLRKVLGTKSPWDRLVKVIESTDLAVIHGDGAMVGNGIHPRTMLFLAYLIKKELGKPVIIVNHTADFDHPLLHRTAQEVYPLFDDVVFRDHISVEKCQDMCRGRFAPDTAFWFKPTSKKTWISVAGRPTYFDAWPDKAQFDPSEPYLCVGGSTIFYGRQSLSSTISGYTALLKHIQLLYPGQIVLTASAMFDQEVFRPIARQMNLPLVGLATPVQQAVDVLGNADAYIGGRWHPSIFALRGGTPVCLLSANTFKMKALAEMAGLYPPAPNAESLEDAQVTIGEQLARYLEEGDGLRRRLHDWADSSAQDAWHNVDYLKERARAR